MRSTDLDGVRDDHHGYDASGNGTSILDLLPSNVGNRSMTYDDQDRLKTAIAPHICSTATCCYDALNNLISITIFAGISERDTLHNINAPTNRLDRITNGRPGFNVTYGNDHRGKVTQCNRTTWLTD